MTMKRSVFRALWITALILAGCDEGGSSSGLLLPQAHAVDPTFQVFYDQLGGEEVLGPGISPLFVYQDVFYQYTESSLLVHNPSAPENQRYSLGPLGIDMGISEPVVPPPANSEERYVEGHIIYSLFVPHYEAMGGLRYTGAPLTEVHYNPDKNRYEQFFANIGFYWVKGDPAEKAHLLAYGAWKCDAKCRTRPPEASTVELPFHVSPRFSDTVMRLGADFTGYAITDEYQTPDGYFEQVFENVVLVVAPDHPTRVLLRAVTDRLGFRAEPMNTQLHTNDDFFYAVQGELGYTIPKRFYEYIIQRNGFEISGPPISSIARVGEAVYQQCFKNLCIQAYLDPLGKITVRPSPLGYSYRRLPILAINPDSSVHSLTPELPVVAMEPQVELDNQTQDGDQVAEVASEAVVQPEVDTPSTAQRSGDVVAQIWEGYTMVSTTQSQEIGVSVLQGGQPVANVEPDLTVTLPGNDHRTYYMYPTGIDGQSRLSIDPVAAESGTLIPYQVCIYDLVEEAVCVSDTFLIWNSP